jgi:hypothetical protein
MFGGKALLRVTAQKNRLLAPLVPLSSALSFFFFENGEYKLDWTPLYSTRSGNEESKRKAKHEEKRKH